MWSWINRALTAAVDAWLWPLRSFPPFVQLLALALPVTILALVAYRYTSDQKGIHAVKNRLKAYLLEMRLFKDDLAVTLSAQGQIFKNSMIYTGYALVPMAVMIIPVVLILIQVESRYALRPLRVGESTILEVRLASARPASELDAELIVPPGLTAATPALRLDDENSILWRVRADEPGEYTARVLIGDQEFPKQIRVCEQGHVSAAVHAAGDFSTLAHPLEEALPPDAVVSSIEMTYPRDRGEFAGLSSASWIILAASLVFGYLLRGLFGVTF